MNAHVARDISWSRHDLLSKLEQTLDNGTKVDYLNVDGMWSEEFHEYFGGRCHTWKPTMPTQPGETNSLRIGLKNDGDYIFNRLRTIRMEISRQYFVKDGISCLQICNIPARRERVHLQQGLQVRRTLANLACLPKED
jgi:hypothetical protein